MNRLDTELQRLYATPASASGSTPEPLVRTAVLELARPADWPRIGAVWRGVQSELELPAPAIAVSGVDAFQLWFALAQPVPAAQAMALLQGLRAHYLGDIAVARIGMQVGDVAGLPPQQRQPGQWSAFVAPDLAPVFADDPWLDTAPSPDGQADLLARLECIKPAGLQAALARLGASSVTAGPGATPVGGAALDAKRFLQQVMQDETVALALRIEAAKALLPWLDERRPRY